MPRDEQVLAWFPHQLEEAWDSGSPLLSDPASRAAVLVFVGREPLGVADHNDSQQQQHYKDEVAVK